MSKKLKVYSNLYVHPFANSKVLFEGLDFTMQYDKADVIILPGGADWYPLLYSNVIHPKSYWNINDDIRELRIMRAALVNNKIILGICRGAQGLCIAVGGKLFQDVNNHQLSHQVTITSKQGDDAFAYYETNSSHHQMLDLATLTEGYDYKLLGYSKVSTKISGISAAEMEYIKEPELVLFDRIGALGVQGHPEWATCPNNYSEIILESLNDLYDSKDGVISDEFYKSIILRNIDEMIEKLSKINVIGYKQITGSAQNTNQPTKPKKTDSSFVF